MSSQVLVKQSNSYHGELKDGKRHGFGTMFYSSGAFYIGNWKEGEYHGTGLHRYINGDLHHGEWFEYKRHGRGLGRYVSGNSYDGEWFENKMHGKGLYEFANGDWYDGEWFGGLYHGRGVYKHSDGGTYDGEWLDDKKHGRGLYQYANGDSYDGEWRKGKHHGRGHFKFAYGSSYDGECRNDQRHGRGLHKYADGSSYDGIWLENKRHGRGLFNFTNGNLYYGKWIDDLPNHDNELWIVLQDNSGLKRILTVHPDSKTSAIFNGYEILTGKSPCRLKYKERYIFYSQSKKKSLKYYGICNDDVIVVEVPVLTDMSNNHMANHAITSSTKKRKVAKAKRQPSRQRRPWAGNVLDADSHRVQHSRKMNLVFKEIQPKLEQIRQHLHDLTLERTQPKDKAKSSKQAPANLEQVECRPISVDTGSKAGKGSFIVNVGEANNLYKTSKHSKLIGSKPSICLDLHKLTKEQALAALNDSLHAWIETANSGLYPFVIQVRIVCGKGSQLLSEVVMQWINSQQQVAHAPKQKQ
eukprot:scaffold43406_cov36-Cyclotella_meneghiniana.AAC.1